LLFQGILFVQWLTRARGMKIQIAVNGTGFNARGSLSFIEDWSPVLTNPTLQIAQESMTGWKEVW
jgi:hypothetical protein